MSHFPSKDEILEFIRKSPNKVGKREIARAFNIRGSDKIPLKAILKELAEEGAIEKGRKAYHEAGALPAVAVIDIFDQDTDGELLGKPEKWDHVAPPPRIFIAPGSGRGRRGIPAFGIGDRVLARLKLHSEGHYDARVIKRIGKGAQKVLGLYRYGPHKGEGRAQPVERKSRYEIAIDSRFNMNAEPGDLVTVEMESRSRHGLKQGRITEILGRIEDQRSVSLIAIHSHDIPVGFSDEEEAQATAAQPITELGSRTDLRDLPLVTIDPVDARDFDDAVHAAPDHDPNNAGGWIVHVAIADVAHYVRTDSPLDRGARLKGNSCYFPDRVVPMLPEELSNDLCSLRPLEDRPCMAVRMVFDKNGRKLRHKFIRGLMRSHARLTYQQAQAAIDGHLDDTTTPLLDDVLKPLWQAYAALARARDARHPLDLDLPEHKIELDDEGHITRIAFRERLDAHRLIEECMIQANVCAAETLEDAKLPFIYRVHDSPAEDKVAALTDFLHSLNLKIPGGQVLKPQHFNDILQTVKDSDEEDMVNVVVLRTQSQAIYSTRNLGHFGLHLRRYAHFTSPIRRYADLTVHRALIRTQKLGNDGLTDTEIEKLDQTAEMISTFERRAMAAERDSTDRYIASFLSERVGARFKGSISGVTRFGLFIRLDDTGADGIVPMRSLDDDFYVHDEKRHALIGERRGGQYVLGQHVDVKLMEATPISGGLRFDMITAPSYPAKPPGSSKKHRSKKSKKHKPKRRSR